MRGVFILGEWNRPIKAADESKIAPVIIQTSQAAITAIKF